jgi:regulator of sigma D
MYALLQKINVTSFTSTLALSLAEAKLHLNILDTSFDDLITDYLAAAHQMLYNETSILVDGTAVGYLKALKDFVIDIRDVSTVVVKYYDANNDLQTWANTNYIVTDNVVEITGSLPATYDRDYPIQVTVTTTTQTNPMVVQALRMIMGDFFEMRQSNVQGNNTAKELSRTTEWQLNLISKRIEV